MKSNELHFTEERFAIFKQKYNEAVKDKKKDFMFDGCEIVTDYAKYVIEHLQPKFKN